MSNATTPWAAKGSRTLGPKPAFLQQSFLSLPFLHKALEVKKVGLDLRMFVLHNKLNAAQSVGSLGNPLTT